MGTNAAAVCTPEELWRAIGRFRSWLAESGGVSYDPYDIWGTAWGRWSRRIYYEKKALGVPLIAPILIAEIVCPGVRSWFVQKQHFATADAQLALAFLNLHALTGDKAYLAEARELGEHLLRTSIPGYSGHCWGYPFDWQNNQGLWKKNTPYITATPYCFEAFLGLFAATGEQRYQEIAASIARFVYTDLNDTPSSDTASAASYSPHDETQVVNASAYRAFVLLEAARRFHDSRYEDRAWKNVSFVLQTQRPDGSWLYGLTSPSEAFIDHFHTCFVLKNLFKIHQLRNDADVREAIQRGWRYYRQSLFDRQGAPRSFAVQPRTQIVRMELYNIAEAITLGALLRDTIGGALDLARDLGCQVIRKYQLPEGYFITRIYSGGLRHKLPFLRWPQSQIFYALTNLLRFLQAVPQRTPMSEELDALSCGRANR